MDTPREINPLTPYPYKQTMNKQEFTKRVGEKHADDFEDANALYMALPNTDKDTFCALWKLEKETGLRIFAELACWVRAYNVEKEESSTFAECCRPFHECKIAHKLEARIKAIAAAVQAAASCISH